MIRTSYDPEADVLHLTFASETAKYDGAEEVAPGVFVEFDADGNAIGVEVLSVRLRLAGTYGRNGEDQAYARQDGTVAAKRAIRNVAGALPRTPQKA